jgi:DNA replication protein DnaC
MLIEQTKDKLAAMKLHGMVATLEQWVQSGQVRQEMDPADLVGLLTDAEWTARENRRLTQRRREAKFPLAATVEEIDYRHPRSLSKSQMMELISCRWVAAHQNVIVSGPTGTGKTFLACALGDKACREGHRVYYARAPRFFGDLYRARAEGTYLNFLKRLAKTPLLVIDDWGSTNLEGSERRDLREVMEDRYGVSSTLITSQLEPKDWHAFIGDETVADGICDRIVHNAHRIKLTGESMRKKRGLGGSPE